ncbi:MAG: patatin family protein [Desulfarculaceae bacterium]|jgi:predicted patatin/cPLA2 family phospholipase
MNLDQAGLILEGGGLRGIYTSGVLRYFMERQMYFPYVIGVSIGACNGANYVSRQPERNRIVNTRFVNDRRYLSYLRLLTKGELFGMEFIFDVIPNSLVPFDLDTYLSSGQIFITTVTDCATGQALYFEKNDMGRDGYRILQASCSLPFIAHPVEYQGKVLMDGGIADPVPIRKSISDGNLRHVLILTQPRGYRKSPNFWARLARRRYPHLPGLCEALDQRPAKYNATMDLIDSLEDKGEVFVIRPQAPLGVKRAERNQSKLYLAYDRGYEDGARAFEAMCNYLSAA